MLRFKVYRLAFFLFFLNCFVYGAENLVEKGVLLRDKAVFRFQGKVYFFSDVLERLKAVARYECLVKKGRIEELFFPEKLLLQKKLFQLSHNQLGQKQVGYVTGILNLLKFEVFSWRKTNAGKFFTGKVSRVCPYPQTQLKHLKTLAGIDEYLHKNFDANGSLALQDLKKLMTKINRQFGHVLLY